MPHSIFDTVLSDIAHIGDCIYKLIHIELHFSSCIPHYHEKDSELQVVSLHLHTCLACYKYNYPVFRSVHFRKRDHWNDPYAYCVYVLYI